jgi:divalent metal cation (Fe/Co/Zn/Cd) transporter
MAKLDEIKEFIGFLKALFITSIAIMSSLIAYLYKENIQDNFLVLCAIIVNIVVTIFLFKKILKEIKSLRDL